MVKKHFCPGGKGIFQMLAMLVRLALCKNIIYDCIHTQGLEIRNDE